MPDFFNRISLRYSGSPGCKIFLKPLAFFSCLTCLIPYSIFLIKFYQTKNLNHSMKMKYHLALNHFLDSQILSLSFEYYIFLKKIFWHP